METTKYKFLVAEDNPVMLKMIRSMLQTLGYDNVVHAMDGQEAWKIMQEDEDGIEIVLADFLMPKMDGLQLLQLTRNSEDFYNIPFVMITSVDDTEQVMSTTEEDIDYYMVKPVTADKLDKCIKTVLKKRYDPDPYHRALNLGRKYLHDGRHEIAFKALEEARNLQPGQSATYYYMAQIDEKVGRLDEAEENYKKCTESSHNLYVKSLDGLSRIYMKKNEFAKAVKALEMGTEISPTNIGRYIDLSAAYSKLGDKISAVGIVEKAAKLGEKTARKDITLAEKIADAFLSCGLDAQAEKTMKNNLGSKTEEIALLNHMGILCRRRKEYDRAKTFYERALKISPSSELINHNYAVLFVEMKEYQMAEAYLNRVLRQNPDFKEAKVLLDKMKKRGVI